MSWPPGGRVAGPFCAKSMGRTFEPACAGSAGSTLSEPDERVLAVVEAPLAVFAGALVRRVFDDATCFLVDLEPLEVV